ncbi:LBF_2127 family putative lipoprotein [Leptonema illini]|uniref:Putative lipoprotein n=1 Tax=Leptonema illini DSM 21528 TaxID=929563 RepID=H2CBS4_9LEPT|nr:hypothetical protein [Leptonema illini]EHQ08528.1 putative lipoprotein [Leptonema illini DSM 21528]
MRLPALLLILCLLHCSADVRQVPLRRPFPAPQPGGKVLYIGIFDIISSEREEMVAPMKESFRSFLQSERYFADVRDMMNDAGAVGKEDVIIDIRIGMQLDESYNWWYTWPGVYPFSAYWPFQGRQARYRTEMDVQVNGLSEQPIRFMCSRSNTDSVVFYGFFRVAWIESIIAQTNLEIFDECSRRIVQTVRLYDTKSEKPSPEKPGRR